MPFSKCELLLFICLHAALIVPHLATEIRLIRRVIEDNPELYFTSNGICTWKRDVIVMETV